MFVNTKGPTPKLPLTGVLDEIKKVTKFKFVSFLLFILIQGCASIEGTINVQNILGRWDCVAHYKVSSDLMYVTTYSGEMRAEGFAESVGIVSFYSSEFPSAKVTLEYKEKQKYRLKKDTITFITTDMKIINIIEDNIGLLDEELIQEFQNQLSIKQRAKVIMKDRNSIEYKHKNGEHKNSCVRAEVI